MPDTPSPHSPHSPKLIVIGAGVMGSALLLSALKSLAQARETIAVDPDPKKLEPLRARSVNVFTSIADASTQRTNAPASVLLAIKPQSLATAASDLATLLRPGDALISILAGVTIARLQSIVPTGVHIIRAMPSTPARVNMCVTGLTLGPDVSPTSEAAAFAQSLFRSAGPLVMHIDESMMDAFTAIAGSGPAYVFYLAESLVGAAIDVGFSPADADKLVRATLLASSTLLSQSEGETPAQLRAGVTSKGGTTNAACTELDQRNVMDAFRAAILAARNRGQELGRVT